MSQRPIIPAAGRIPRNRHGNIELWHPLCLPVGCVHLPFPRVAVAAAKLGFDYVPSVVGFERKGATTVPQIEGIVVRSENAGACMPAPWPLLTTGQAEWQCC